MLASAFLHIHQSYHFHFPVRAVPLQDSPPKPKSRKSVAQAFCPSCKITSISSSFENSSKINDFLEIPDVKISNSPSPTLFLDPDVLGSMLQSCSNPKEVKRVHTIVIKGLGRSVTFVDNNLISVYVRFGELSDARHVFDQMPERDIVSWTAMLSGYLKVGREEEVERLFRDLIGNCVKPNASTLVCVLNLCGRRLDFKVGEQIHSCVVKGRWNNLIVDSALIYFYAQCGDLSGAFKVFNRMAERDVICWTTMITACAQLGDAKEALLMFSRMQFDGFQPNEFTVCSVLKACGEDRALKFGRQLHSAIVKRMFKHDVFLGSSLVGMYVKCGEVLDAKIVFDRMPKRNTVTWTSMIAGYAQNGFGEEAIELFQRMKRRRIFANNLTVVSILSACGLVRSLSLGKEIHAQILKNHIERNIYIGSTLIWFYCRCGTYGYATRVLEAMPSRDVVSWTAIISGHTHIGNEPEALKFLNNMLWEGVEPNPFTYSSALKACTKLEAVKEGKWIHASANKTLTLSNVYVGTALINLYAKCGFVNDAFRVFDKMPERNLVSWKTMIIGYARNGLCKEALKLMYQMQAEGIKVDDFTTTTVLSACGDVKWNSESSSLCSLKYG